MCNRCIIYCICLITAIGLLVGSFFVPPMGIIDKSVLQACSLLLGFYCAYDLPNTVRSMSSFKIQKGDFSVSGEKKKE